jgi:hypothetical protein
LLDQDGGRTVETYHALTRLSFLNPDDELLEVNILGGQGKGFTEPEAAAPEESDQRSVPSTTRCALRADT